MNWMALLTCLVQEDTPDEEQRTGAPTPSRSSEKTIQDSEKVGSGAAVIAQSREATCNNHGNLEHVEDQEYDEAVLPNVKLDQQDACPRGLHHIFSKISSITFPSASDEEETQAYIPHYRILPILSGVAIPFCIVLDIPGLLATDTDSSTSQRNPALLNIGIMLSILCAVFANVCLVVRFLERRLKAMTILCIVFLLIHDIINITVLTTFGITDEYVYSQSFWATFCSTIVSMFINVTLIVDFVRAPDIKRSGSGLTRIQRSLLIITIGLFCYIALGALVNSLLLDLTFINGLYFTVVTIETVGFGDIFPHSTSSRIFVVSYGTLGIIYVAFVVGYVRETVLESLEFGYRNRLLAIQERRRAARLRRRVEKRWRHGIICRLRERHELVWIHKNTNDSKSLWSIFKAYFWRAKWGIWLTARKSTHQNRRGQHGTHLNLWALPLCQLEAAALEAGAPLDTLLPGDFYDACGLDVKHPALPSWFAVHPICYRNAHAAEPLTHRRLGAMAAIVTKLTLAVYGPCGNLPSNGLNVRDASAAGEPQPVTDCFRGLQARKTSTSEDRANYCEDSEDPEKKAYYVRSGLSWLWLLIFWLGGAAIFKATEGWTYGLAIYFCFTALTALGYGDLVPRTPAGRSIFVVWALVGVPTITTLISVVSQAYTTRYKRLLDRNSSKRVVRQCRRRNKVELRENAQHFGTSTEAKFVLQEREKTEVVEEDESTSESAVTDVVSTSKPNLHIQHTKRSLEKLSQRALTAAWSIQQYTQLMDDFDGRSVKADKFVDEAVWGLVDDILGSRKLTESAKQDILNDHESRQTLASLGIKRSLKELVNISEQAATAVRELDQIVATLEGKEEQDETEISI